MMVRVYLQTVRQRLGSPIAWLKRGVLVLVALFFCWGAWGQSPAQAGVTDDRFDGNIFVLYASNGSLVPPKNTLAETIESERPAVVMFYTDDSAECKDNALVMSELQAFYRQRVNFMPISVDTIPSDRTYGPTEAKSYYNGRYVPQFLVIDPQGQVAMNTIGQTPYEAIDDQLRKIYDLPERPDPFPIERPAFSPSPTADTTFWTAAVRGVKDIDTSNQAAPGLTQN